LLLDALLPAPPALEDVLLWREVVSTDDEHAITSGYG
jgi:hypothetical protein